MLTDQGNLQGIPLHGHAPRQTRGVPDLSAGPDVNVGLDPEEALKGITEDHRLSPVPTDDPTAGSNS